ncbi:gamma-glutamyltransferase family protein [Egicoccus halophilus]|uniref:Gamma-glutamyltransferase n=1 Tax=Egicoccus halophilus TaxID=1670830 RepID=A0A8J3EUY7_9ACTN|nr:gamma-glutamyltransferase [Egicoccus halophilus]GGI06963.1 gamma-glutamyltransferase [Egicoccus halophilus]
MMTDRWLNYVLSVVVVLGMVGVAIYNQPRDRQERAEFLDQELTELEADDWEPPSDRDPVQLQRRAEAAPVDDDEEEVVEETELLDEYGVSASHPVAVDVGMQVLDAGGNAVDAAVAVAYALGVAEPFGSGVGGGGSLLLHPTEGEPRYYDYRETAPLSGELPASDIGVPGFVAGMEHIHEQHGSLALDSLIEYAARLAEDGVEVDDYLAARLQGAAYRMPIHLLPRWFPNGTPIAAGETLHQPEYAEALRMIQEQGAEVMYTGELAEQIADTVGGLELEDLAAYEVLETEPAVGSFAGRRIVSGGAPVSGPPVIQLLQIADAGGIADLDPYGVDGIHLMAQAWRAANDQRSAFVGDPSMEDVDLDALLDPAYTQALADAIPDDGFVPVGEDEGAISFETDTTHVVVVDRDGNVVSMTNTLSNFFGSGLPVSGFFLNDQLKNFDPEPDSINAIAPGKRPRSFVTPTVVLDDQDRPELAIGSPGGRRIPNIVAQVIVRWAAHGQPLEEAIMGPRFHLERSRLELEESVGGDASSQLAARGYEVTTQVPTTEYFGGVQALRIDWDQRTIEGADDTRRTGTWASGGG